MIANFFWSGDDFQYLDRLTILSHLSVGHEVVIWLWGDTPNSIYWPSDISDIEIKNADEVVSCSAFHKKLPQGYPKEKKLRVVSAYWKFHFMYKRGGLYCDTDAIALKAFPSDEWINISSDDIDKVYYIGVLKAPPKHPVFKYCINNIMPRWGNPRVYSAAVKKYGIKPTHNFRLFYPFSAVEHQKYLKKYGTTILFSPGEIPNAFSVHVYGNRISSLNINQDTINKYPNSILYKINERFKPKTSKTPISRSSRVAILMLSWLRFDMLLKTLQHLPTTSINPLHLILRVQGNERLTDSDRKKVIAAASSFASTDIYFTRDNVGTAAARLDLIHRGAKQNYPYMMFTDDDITFPKQGIDKQIEVLDKYSNIGAVSLRPSGTPRVQLVSEDGKVSLSRWSEADKNLVEVYLVGSASIMFRSELYTEHLVAPDSAYYIGTWDWDFVTQIRKTGHKVCVLTNYEIINKRGGNAEYLQKRKNKLYLKENRALFIQKWGFDPSKSRRLNSKFVKPADINNREAIKEMLYELELEPLEPLEPVRRRPTRPRSNFNLSSTYTNRSGWRSKIAQTSQGVN